MSLQIITILDKISVFWQNKALDEIDKICFKQGARWEKIMANI